MGCDLPGFSVHEIVKARILEWVAISCSRGSSQPRDWTCLCLLLEKAMAPCSNTLTWQIPWMEEPGLQQSMGTPIVRHSWATSLSLSCIGEGNGNPTPVFLPGESQGRGSLVGCGGAWWAAVYGVAQSRTQLKRLSSSSSSSSSVSRVFCIGRWILYY